MADRRRALYKCSQNVSEGAWRGPAASQATPTNRQKNTHLQLSRQYALRRTVRRMVGFSLGLAVVAFFTARLWLPKIGQWLAQPVHIGHVDAIAVLGGDRQRSLHGIALYREGLAPELWQTGTVSKNAQYVVPIAVQRGVPAAAIHLLPSTSTWEDGSEIVALAKQKQVHSILIVTDWFHSRRALCVIQQQLTGSGIDMYYDAPPISSYGPDNWWRQRQGRKVVLSELVKIAYYWWQYRVTPWRC